MKITKWFIILLSVCVIIWNLVGCTVPSDGSKNVAINKNEQVQPRQNDSSLSQQKVQNTKELIVSFIDVGQGDSILVQAPSGKNMLIDAGVPEAGDKVVSYLKSRGVNKIDILVATHPHSDHIGGLPEVISVFYIGDLYMPKVGNNTYSYEKLLNSIKRKKITVKTGKAGVKLDLGDDVDALMLAPNSTYYDDLNNYSVVIKIKYGNNTFLLTGDAGTVSEKEMLEAGYDLKADVLKVGHHGSAYSTSLPFLNAVNPRYAVISVGKNNDYGHPAKVTLNKLKAHHIIVYRTDQNGTIVATSDGNKISFSFH